MRRALIAIRFFVILTASLLLLTADSMAERKTTTRPGGSGAENSCPDQCPQGPRGPQGQRGLRGPQGPQGPQGPAGGNGSGAVYVTSTVLTNIPCFAHFVIGEPERERYQADHRDEENVLPFGDLHCMLPMHIENVRGQMPRCDEGDVQLSKGADHRAYYGSAAGGNWVVVADDNNRHVELISEMSWPPPEEEGSGRDLFRTDLLVYNGCLDVQSDHIFSPDAVDGAE